MPGLDELFDAIFNHPIFHPYRTASQTFSETFKVLQDIMSIFLPFTILFTILLAILILILVNWLSSRLLRNFRKTRYFTIGLFSLALIGYTTIVTIDGWKTFQAFSDRMKQRQAESPRAGAVVKNEDLKVGYGSIAEVGKEVTIHYTGTLTDGKKFDSSRDHNRPLQMGLGTNQLIRGLDRGIEGMRVGGIRKIIVPPELAYGERGAANVIPPNATLIYEVELLKVE